MTLYKVTCEHIPADECKEVAKSDLFTAVNSLNYALGAMAGYLQFMRSNGEDITDIEKIYKTITNAEKKLFRKVCPLN